MVIDSYIENLLTDDLSKNIDEIQVNPDGTWTIPINNNNLKKRKFNSNDNQSSFIETKILSNEINIVDLT